MNKLIKTETQNRKEKVNSIVISFAKQGDRINVIPMPLIKLLSMLKHDKFASAQLEYDKEKSLNGKADKYDFFPSFLPHSNQSGKQGLKDKKTGEWEHTRWEMSGLISADLDGVPVDKFKAIWEKLLATNPLFLFRSPNGGIKAFWTHNLANTQDNKINFKKLVQFTIRKLLDENSLRQYYDQAPTNPNSRCFVTGGEKFQIQLNPKFVDLDMTDAVTTMSKLLSKSRAFNTKIDTLSKKANKAGDYTIYDDLPETLKRNKDISAKKFVDSADKRSSGSGNNNSYSLAGSCIKLGLSMFETIKHVQNFKSMSVKRTFDVRKQVEKCFRNGGHNILGGQIIRHSQDTRTISALNKEIEVINNAIKLVTFDDKHLAKSDDDKPIDNAVKLSDLSGINATIFTGLPGSGKSYKMVRQSVDNMLKNGITLYVCADKKSFNANVKDSRYHEANKYLDELLLTKKITNYQHEKYCINLQTVCDENEGSVRRQFGAALDDILSIGKGGIIYLTIKGLETINLDAIPQGKATIVFDDISSLPQAHKISDNFTDKEVADFKKYIAFETHGTTHKVTGILKDGLDYVYKYGDVGDKSAMVKRIDAAQKTKASNLATYYTFSGDEISTRSTITTLEMINLDILKIFKHTYIIGDEIEFNPYVIMLNKRADVTFEKVHLDCRTGNVKTRLPKILYVTDHRFSKTRLTRTQEIPKRISKIIIDHLGQKHDNLLLCVNKDQKENKVFESILDKIFNTKTTSPITKGINNLQSNSLIACLFNMDMDISSKHILSDITGISFDELETYIHRNNLIQNLFRGVLRNPNSKEICDFIAPSKIDAEYLQNRLFKELGYKVNIELLDDDINKLFVSGKSGRPTKSNSGVVLKGNDKSALSKLRKRFGERVNDIEPIYLISKMKGLMKEKAQNMFDKLVAEYEQKANHIPKTFADLKTE